jgi:hypothetical protein
MHPYVFRNFTVYDAIMYAGESRLFYLRVRSLDAYVDYFVVGYSCLTFQNNPAPPLSYAPLEAELSEYDDKIIVFRTCPRPRNMRAWDRESRLRIFLQQSIARLHPQRDDLVMNCDCDEIPTQQGLNWIFARPPTTFYKFKGLYFWYTFRWIFADEFWIKASIVRWGALRAGLTLQDLRRSIRHRTPNISLVHCSYCFSDIASVVRKLESFCHHEFAFEPFINPNYIRACVECGKGLVPDHANRIAPYKGDVREFVPFVHLETEFLTKKIGFTDMGKLTSSENVSHFKRYISCTR